MDKENQKPGIVPASNQEAEIMPIGYADDTQIAAWKSQYKMMRIPEVYSFDDDDQPHVTYFKKPDLEHLQLLADKAKNKDEVGGMKTLFNTLRIGGSEVVPNDTQMLMECFSGLGKIFKQREAIVKKR